MFIKVVLSILFGNLFSLASILYLNNFENLAITTETREIVLYSTTALIFLGFGLDQVYPQLEENKLTKYFKIHCLLLFSLSIASFVFNFFHGSHIYTIFLIASIGSIVHLTANYYRANHNFNKYLFLVHIFSKFLIFFTAYLAVKEKSVDFISLALVAIIFFTARKISTSAPTTKVVDHAISQRFFVSGCIAIATPFLLRMPYFLESFYGTNSLLLNTQDILTTVFLLAFVPIQQLYRIREAKNKFTLADHASHDLKETFYSIVIIAFFTVVIILLSQYSLLRLHNQSTLLPLCFMISSFYLAYFSARNAMQIIVFSVSFREQKTKIILFGCCFLLAIILSAILKESYFAQFLLFCIPAILAHSVEARHVNKLMFGASLIFFLLGRFNLFTFY